MKTEEMVQGCGVLAGLAVLCLLLALTGCNGRQTTTSGENGEAVRPITSVYAYGIVEARRFSTLSAKFPGKIERILVHEGEPVKQEQVLARFEARQLTAQVAVARANITVAAADLAEGEAGARPEEIKAGEEALKEAEAQLKKARADADRYRALHHSQVVPAAEWEGYRLGLTSAEARRNEARQQLKMLKEGTRPETLTVLRDRLALARARLDEAEAALADSLLTAPYDGVITRKHREEGEAMDIGMPVMDIATLDDRYVRAEIDETDIGRLKVGQQAKVFADGFTGLEFAGKVTEIKQQMGPKQLLPSDPSKIVDFKVLDVEISLPADCPYPIKLPVNVRISLE